MKLWKISQDSNIAYDTFDSAVVAAETEDEARNTHPGDLSNNPIELGTYGNHGGGVGGVDGVGGCNGDWVKPDKVTVEYIGEAKEGTPRGSICASFNAG